MQVYPVIHYSSDEQALRNAAIAYDTGCSGVFLIQMEQLNQPLIKISSTIKQRWNMRVGLNLLGVDPVKALSISKSNGLDMTWTDAQLTHSEGSPWERAEQISMEIKDHLFFVGVAFKHQPFEPNPAFAARKALELEMIPCTSGTATGVAANSQAIRDLRAAIEPSAPLAIASGITPENVADFAPSLTHILVSTGVSKSFYEFDAEKLIRLRENIS